MSNELRTDPATSSRQRRRRALDPRAVDGAQNGAPQQNLSPGAVALLNAIASVAPAAPDPWSAFPPVLDVDHIARILGLTRGSAREAARRGRIPMTRRLGRYMVDQSVFRRWLAGYDVWAEGLVPANPFRDG